MNKKVLLGIIMGIIITSAVVWGFVNLKKGDNVKDATLTNENVQEKIGEHLKWFSAAYDGDIYGWPRIYTYKNVTNEVTLPDVERSSYAELYELVGAKSKENMKSELAKYVDSSKFSKFEYFLADLKDYNGKVYWINGGVGDAPVLDITTAKVISSENGISKVKLAIEDPFEDTDKYVIVTVEYKDGKYLITDWSEQ